MPDRPYPSNATRMLLILGGSFTTAMAAYHFFLPTMFGWAGEVRSVFPTVRWALFSLNFFFSFVLLALGVLTLLGVLLRRTHEWTYLAVAVAAAGFWLVNGSYQVIVPMPMPHRLVLLSYFLKAYAFGVALLYVIPIVRIARARRASVLASLGPTRSGGPPD